MKVSCPHAGFTALENQGSLSQLIPRLIFIVIGCVQCRETWHLPPEEHGASKDSGRMRGRCCGDVANCSDPLQEGGTSKAEKPHAWRWVEKIALRM